jgi:ankyrin repeat protein
VLINGGSDLTLKDAKGDGVLHIAVMARAASVVKLLLERREIDINERGGHGKTPFTMAKENGDEVIAALLTERLLGG